MSARCWKRLATSPAISDVLQDTDGSALNLSGTTVTWWMGPLAVETPDGLSHVAGTIVQLGTATVSGATATYQWGTADLDTKGLYGGFWQIDYGGGTIERLPQGGSFAGDPGLILVRVTDDLA